MTEERWHDIVGHIKDNFELLAQRSEAVSDDGGSGTVEVVEFLGPAGKMKLEFTTQPLVLGKRTIGSRRIGGDVTIEYTYSETENTHKLKAFRHDADSDTWVEIEKEMPTGGMFF